MKKSIQESEEICNSLRKEKIYETVTGYALEYITAIILSIFSAGYRGKTVDMEQHSRRHRTSIPRFLRSEDWDDRELEAAMKKHVIQTICEEAGLWTSGRWSAAVMQWDHPALWDDTVR